MRIKYVGPVGDLPIELQDTPTQRFYATDDAGYVDVPDDVAGRPPSAEYLAAVDTATKIKDRFAAGPVDDDERVALELERRDAVAVMRSGDVGAGALAQWANWVAADKKAARPAAEKE